MIVCQICHRRGTAERTVRCHYEKCGKRFHIRCLPTPLLEVSRLSSCARISADRSCWTWIFFCVQRLSRLSPPSCWWVMALMNAVVGHFISFSHRTCRSIYWSAGSVYLGYLSNLARAELPVVRF